MTKIAAIFGFCATALITVSFVNSDEPQTFESLARPFLQTHCMDCHGADAAEGEVSFHELTGVDANNAELWKRIWEQVALKEMPPKDESDQPTAMKRLALTDWITGELQRAMREKGGFETHLHPAKGNHLDHDLLFGDLPDGLQPTSTPARIWRIHPLEHLTRLNELINREPTYDSRNPGLRAHGDQISPNREGEIKVYFGLATDRVVLDPNENLRYFSTFEELKKPPKKEKKKRPTAEELGFVSLPKGDAVHVRIARVVKNGKTKRSLTSLPEEQRRGILTHPSWLVAHSDAMDNHAILRGKWIRERLLGGAVPDVPITVDAMLPDEPKSTLRHRMRVTRESECWRCHQKMDPLGLPFERYNHLGLYRNKEQGESVDTSGTIIGSGDEELDGPVNNATELIDRLAASERVKQVFVRHAFRFWMGRNETINDAPVLQDAYLAYESSGGSMKALLTSLLTSDAFLYRKVERSQDQ